MLDEVITIDGVYCNAPMSSKQMRKFAQIDANGSELLKNAMQRLNLSARAYDRIIRITSYNVCYTKLLRICANLRICFDDICALQYTPSISLKRCS